MDINTLIADNINGVAFILGHKYELPDSNATQRIKIPYLFAIHRDNSKEVDYSVGNMKITSTRLPSKTRFSDYIGYSIIPLKKMRDESVRIALYPTARNENIDDELSLLFLKPLEKEIEGVTELHGVQQVAEHPVKNLIATIGKDLSTISIDSKEIINSVELPLARDKAFLDSEGKLSFSSCGRFIALSYTISGEIEVRDANTLDLMFTLEGLGIPQSDLDWDVTSKFLACRFRSRKGSEYSLVVWDLRNRKIVLETKSSDINIVRNAFKWSSYSSKLASLVDKKRVEIFEFD